VARDPVDGDLRDRVAAALAGRAAAEAYLARSATPVAIVAGNHDVRWTRATEGTSILRGRFFLHHGDQSLPVPADTVEVVGHFHPAISWHDGAGTRLKLPALVASPQRLVLPAFSPWAAGVAWKPGAPGEVVYAIGRKRIFTVSPERLQKQPS